MSVLKHRHNGHTARHSVPAWPGRPDADAPISFDDIASLPDPDWIGRSPLAGLVLDAELLEPLELTDWSEKLAWTLAYVDAAVAVRVKNAKAELGSDRNAVGALFAPFFAQLADLAAELDDDRAALYAGIAGEHALIGQWEQYAKSFIGLVPGATAKAEVA